jgi:hypothetical protein
MKLLASLLDEQFARLHSTSVQFIRSVPEDLLYEKPRSSQGGVPVYSVGEHILRSAGIVEQVCGGISVSLWDDPFEWTLPEALSNIALVEEYLNEVDAARLRTFALLHTDEDLYKEIAVPSGPPRPIFNVLIEALRKASHHQGRAFVGLRLLSDLRTPAL